MVLNPRLWCLLSPNGISCRSVTLFICRLLSRIIAPQGAFLEVQLEMDGPKRARGTGHLLNFLLTRLPNASALRNFVYNRRARGSELFSPQKIWFLYSKSLKPCSVVQSVQEIVTCNLKAWHPVVFVKSVDIQFSSSWSCVSMDYVLNIVYCGWQRVI